MSLTLALIFCTIVSGTLLTYLYDDDASLIARLASGVCIGFALLGSVGFACACGVGLTISGIILTWVIMVTPMALLGGREFRGRVIADVSHTAHSVPQGIQWLDNRVLLMVAAYLISAVLLCLFFAHAVFKRDGAICTGAISNVGDLPFHIGVISGFLHGQNFPPEHPQLAGVRLTYPFISDFLVALFMRTGTSLSSATFLESYILTLALVGVIYCWAWQLTRDRGAAAFAIPLVLLNGGLGWYLLGDEARRHAQGFFSALMHLSHEYTTERAYGLAWGNILETMLLPQRSFLLGLPLAMIIWTLWCQALRDPKEEGVSTCPSTSRFPSSLRRMLGAGIIAGLLPLIHAHSFVVIITMGACLSLIFRRWLGWVVFFAAASLFALPQLWWITHGAIRSSNFYGWHFGWVKGDQNIWWFWLKNTGPFIPLLIVALIGGLRRQWVPRQLLGLYLPFLLCFLIPNLVGLAPYLWDNIKVLIYWYIASVPLVALLLARLWRHGNARRAVAVALLACMTLAGGLDVWRVVTKPSDWPVFDQGAVACARLITKKSAPRALVLHAPINNHAVFLTGRRSLMGVGFIIWSHGLEAGSRESDIRRIYAGGAGALGLMTHYGIDYVIIGPPERYQMRVNESFFARYKLVGETDGYQLYRVAGP